MAIFMYVLIGLLIGVIATFARGGTTTLAGAAGVGGAAGAIGGVVANLIFSGGNIVLDLVGSLGAAILAIIAVLTIRTRDTGDTVVVEETPPSNDA